MTFRLFLCGLVLFVPSLATAQYRTFNRGFVVNSCSTPIVHSHQAVVVKKELAVAQFIGIPVAIPAAFATYVPSYAQAVYTPAHDVAVPHVKGKTCDEKVAALDAKLDRLIEALSRNVNGGQPVRALDNAVHPGLKIIQTKCATCHTETHAQAKGKGIVLLTDAGALNPALDWDDLKRIKIACITGKDGQAPTMPKGGDLTGEEVTRIDGVLDLAKDALFKKQEVPK